MSQESGSEPRNDSPFTAAGSSPAGETAGAAVTLPSQPDFQVLNPIGRGAYGEVYLTRDHEGNYWAVKVVYRVSFENDRPYEREYNGIQNFEPISRQSESQLQIRHVGRRDEAGYFYYIMEAADDLVYFRDIHPDTYLPRTLKSELQRSHWLPPPECCHIATGLAAALDNLHQHGLIHRDIKPANIVFVNGRPKLADLGLVTGTAQTMTCVGTEGYIPPEGPNSVRADIYALGKVLYEMCTGCHVDDFPKLPENLDERPHHALLLELNRVITRACQADPRKRYQSARQLQKDLERLVATGSAFRPRIHPLAIAGATGLLIAGGAFFWFNQRQRTATPIVAQNPIEKIPVVATPTGTVSVSAKAIIFDADPGTLGMPRRGVPPVRIPLPGELRAVTFPEVTGTVSFARGHPRFGADGDESFKGVVNIQSLGSISGVVDRSGEGNLALMGVFTSATPPGKAPPRLDFVTLKHQAIIAPQLYQTFFIGDGRTGRGTGELQQFVIPEGATDLYLGFAEARNFQGRPGYYADNSGSLTVTYSIARQLK